MSSCRSRSGGTKIGMTFSRKYRSSRKWPALISACRSLLVAASTRASTVIRAGAADRLHRLLLQHAQHLGLRLQAHVADFVEEDRAAVGDLELAPPVVDRAGEGAAHVAEQLAFDQLLGNGRAVHLDERRRLAAAQRVDRAGDQLLARPVLAVDQHAAVGRRRHRHLLAQLAHRVALADHRLMAIDARPQRPVLGLEAPLAQRVRARPAPSCRATAASRRSRTRPS